MGETFQISFAYSEMVRSLENLPDDATLFAHILNHRPRSWNQAEEDEKNYLQLL